jgi:hypothetical protein
MRRELTANKAQALLARIRPADEVAEVRVHIARDHLADVRALDARLKYLAGQIAALVAESGTTLTSLYGIGPLIAGRILAEAGDGARFATKDKFASYNGTAPIDVSSGDQVRHRLSRAGNRRINHALHMMAVTQIRYPGTPGRVYYERKRKEGKTPKEALRCLKRRLSDVVYRQLVLDRRGRIEACGSPTTPRPMRSTSTSPATRSAQAAPPSRRATLPPSTGSSPWTGKTAASSASRSSMPAPASTRTSSRKPKSSAENGCPVPHAGQADGCPAQLAAAVTQGTDAPRCRKGRPAPARISCLRGPPRSPALKPGPQGRRRRRCAAGLTPEERPRTLARRVPRPAAHPGNERRRSRHLPSSHPGLDREEPICMVSSPGAHIDPVTVCHS